MTFEIQTYWNVETLYYVLNAVAAIMAGNGFTGLVKMVFLFAIAIGMFGYMNRQLELAKWFIHALMFVSILNMPIARVAIEDKTGLEGPRVVDHVPFALAAVADASNLAFGFLVSSYETIFSVPDDLGLAKGDVGFGHRILRNINGATVRDAALRADLMQFFKECTLYDIQDGAIKVTDITNSSTSWDTIFSQTSPARFVTYDTLSGAPQTDTCLAVGPKLATRVNDAVQGNLTFAARQLFTRASSDPIATSMYTAAAEQANTYILNLSSSASDSMKQAMFNNVWQEAGSELPALLNDPARLAELQAATAASMASQQINTSNSTISILAQETIPHLRNWIEAIIYGIFPVIVLLIIVSTVESGKKVLGGYMMALAWLGLWPLLFAIINHLSLLTLQHKIAALQLASSGVTSQMMDVFDSTLIDEQSMIAYMVVMVPFIAGAIIKMGQGGIMSMADKMLMGVSSVGGAAGSSVGSGNVSMGQAGIDTVSANTTTMNKFDDRPMTTTGAGMASIGLTNGDVLRVAQNGRVTKDENLNRLGSSYSADRRFESSQGLDAGATTTDSTGNQSGFRSGTVSSAIDAGSHVDTRGQHQGQSRDSVATESGSYNRTHEGSVESGNEYGINSNFSQNSSGQYVGNLGIGLPGGGGTPAAGYDANAEKRMASALEQAGANKSDVSGAVQNFRTAHGAPGGGGMSALRLSGDAQKIYAAAMGRGWNYNQHTGQTERASGGYSYSNSGAVNNSNSSGAQSDQTDRHDKTAQLVRSNDAFAVQDNTLRNDKTAGARNSLTASSSASSHQDLFARPEFWEAVAAKNGVDNYQLMSMPNTKRETLGMEYAAELDAIKGSKQLQTQTLDGQSLARSPAAVATASSEERAALPGATSVEQLHGGRVRQTGYRGVAPTVAKTAPPAVVSTAKADTSAALDARSPDSITARGQEVKDQVRHNASPDREVGDGRRSELGAAAKVGWNDAAGGVRDVVDGVKKYLDGDKK